MVWSVSELYFIWFFVDFELIALFECFFGLHSSEERSVKLTSCGYKVFWLSIQMNDNLCCVYAEDDNRLMSIVNEL